jgi:hypothetical protein
MLCFVLQFVIFFASKPCDSPSLAIPLLTAGVNNTPNPGFHLQQQQMLTMLVPQP